MIIYCITNKINNKKYIGQTTLSMEERFRAGYTTGIISRAIRKYGKDNFKIEQIDTADNINELNEKEIYWIKKLSTLKPVGYNILIGGNNRQTEESREKLRQIHLGTKHSEEPKKKMSLQRREYWRNHPDKLEQQSQSRKGKNNPFYGKTHSDEFREKISLVQKKRVRV